MNYAELIEEISGYLEENDEDSFVARLDDFVIMAEQAIYRAVSLPVTRFVDDGNIVCVAGTQTVTVPTNWLEIFAVTLKNAGASSNETKGLFRKDESFIREVYPVSTTTGEPTDYAIIDQTTILLGPTPGSAYPLLFYYKKFPESIVTAGTTWLGTNCEQALLFGSVYNAYLYLKGDADLLGEYRQKFMAELQLLGYEGDDVPQDRRETT